MPFLDQATSILPTIRGNGLPARQRILQHVNTTLVRRVIELTLVGICAILLLLGLTGHLSKPAQLKSLHLPDAIASRLPLRLAHAAAADIGFSWPDNGWDGIENVFSFGDSYSDTAFDPYGEQPSAKNPLGNPDWTLDLAAGSVWLHFLADTHISAGQFNSSSSYTNTDTTTNTENSTNTPQALHIYNHAISGSTIDPSVIKSYHSNFRASLTYQIYSTFLPLYSPPHTPHAWSPNNTLFTLWFGINDLVIPTSTLTYPPLPKLLKAYSAHLHTLYNLGARNFLVLDIPPIYRAHASAAYASFEAAAVLNFNLQLNSTLQHFRLRHPSAKLFYFSAHQLWSEVLEAPGEFDATAQITHTEEACTEYAALRGKTLVPDYVDERCGVGVEQYFWLDRLHATYPVHELTAERVVEDCFEGDVGGFCSG